jgi:hypothetical protein
MKKITFTLLLAFAFLLTNNMNAQEYKSAVGLRLGYPLSASYKHFLNDRSAFEVTAGFRGYTYYSWFNVGAYYLIHNEIPSIDGLKWYYGGGANVYFWNWDSGFDYGDSSNVSFGISGVIGLDYAFSEIPLNLSADWIPTFFINGYGNGFGGGYGGLSARYILGR